MTTVTYLKDAANETYSDDAFKYISTPRVKDSIFGASAILGISAGAIAGAMAEENTSYGFLDGTLDKYTKSGIDPAVAVDSNNWGQSKITASKKKWHD